jgi:hypothetical protein
MALGCSFPFFPLYPNESSLLELGFYSAGTAVLVLVELIGKIGTVGNLVDLDRVAEASMSHSGIESFPPYGEEGHLSTNPQLEYISGGKRFKREELTAYEKGEEDVGGGNSVGIMKAFTIRRGQRE